jgi:hypothetical protein
MISTVDQLIVARSLLYPATRAARTRFKKARLRHEGTALDEWASEFSMRSAEAEYLRARVLLIKATDRARLAARTKTGLGT